MANWYGTARTNWFTPTDHDKLLEILLQFNCQIHYNAQGQVMISGGDDDGSFPTYAYNFDGEEEDEIEIEFCWEEHVMPYVSEGEVLIIMESGAEKLRYISGHAGAYVRHGDDVQHCSIYLSAIYKLAAETFGIPEEQINPAEY